LCKIIIFFLVLGQRKKSKKGKMEGLRELRKRRWNLNLTKLLFVLFFISGQVLLNLARSVEAREVDEGEDEDPYEDEGEEEEEEEEGTDTETKVSIRPKFPGVMRGKPYINTKEYQEEMQAANRVFRLYLVLLLIGFSFCVGLVTYIACCQNRMVDTRSRIGGGVDGRGFGEGIRLSETLNWADGPSVARRRTHPERINNTSSASTYT
jgi:cell division protein FtsB